MIFIFGKIYSNINTVLDKKLTAGENNVTEQDSIHQISGSGAIQAISAARAGAKISLIGTVGNDIFGKNCLEILRKEGVNTSSIAKSDIGTGLEFSLSSPDNKTTYVTSDGANKQTHIGQIPKTRFNERALLMLSGNIDTNIIHKLLNNAKERNSSSILCLTNNNNIPLQTLSLANIIITSKQHIMHQNLDNYMVELIEYGVLGAKLYKNNSNICTYTPSQNTDFINENAKSCFDVFCGFFASSIQAGLPIKRSIILASKAAQKASEKSGAYDAIPYIDYIQDLERGNLKK